MFNFPQLRQLQAGGTLDTAALLAIAAGGMATHPLVGGLAATSALAGVGMAGMGGAWWGKRITDAIAAEALEGSQLRINSSAPPKPTKDGVHLGYIVDTGEPLIIPMESWTRHAMIVGQSGVGKTVVGNWVMFQQIERGGGLLWVDGKLDPDNLTALYEMAAHAGRLDDLRIISPGTPEMSNTYNPVLYGDPDEVAARLLSVIPATEGNAGADFYRQAANQGITTLVDAAQATGMSYNCADLAVLLMNDNAMGKLARLVPYGSEAQRALAMFLFQFQTPTRHGSNEMKIDIKRLKEVFGGIGGRLNMFGSGKFGRVLNSYSPEVRLTEDVMANRIIYVALPTMGKQEAASNFGKLVLGDLRTAISKVQDLPKRLRPDPPFLGFFDEAGSYVTQSWSRPFEQARSARVVMAPAFQTKANLEVIGEELRAMVAGNTLTKLFFKPGEPDTAQWMADMIGEEMQTSYGISATKGAFASKSSAVISATAGGEAASGMVGFSEQNTEGYRIPPSDLMKLGKGECIVTLDGSNVYHIRTPMLGFAKQFKEQIGDPSITHCRVKTRKGLSFSTDMKLIDPNAEDDA